MNQSDIDWSRRQLLLLAIGGQWAVPRSGLIFQKTGEKSMALILTMPFLPEMAAAAKQGRDVPATEQALLEHQRADYEGIARHFRAAGIEVTDKTNLTNPVKPTKPETKGPETK